MYLNVPHVKYRKHIKRIKLFKKTIQAIIYHANCHETCIIYLKYTVLPSVLIQ